MSRVLILITKLIMFFKNIESEVNKHPNLAEKILCNLIVIQTSVSRISWDIS